MKEKRIIEVIDSIGVIRERSEITGGKGRRVERRRERASRKQEISRRGSIAKGWS